MHDVYLFTSPQDLQTADCRLEHPRSWDIVVWILTRPGIHSDSAMHEMSYTFHDDQVHIKSLARNSIFLESFSGVGTLFSKIWLRNLYLRNFWSMESDLTHFVLFHSAFAFLCLLPAPFEYGWWSFGVLVVLKILLALHCKSLSLYCAYIVPTISGTFYPLTR